MVAAAATKSYQIYVVQILAATENPAGKGKGEENSTLDLETSHSSLCHKLGGDSADGKFSLSNTFQDETCGRSPIGKKKMTEAA